MMEKPNLSGALAQITTGRKLKPIYGMISGLPGVGKTTLAAHAPKPIFLGLEEGTLQLDVSRWPQAQSLNELLDQITAIANEPHPFKTVVFDTVDRLEELIWNQVCREGHVDSVTEYAGGYGMGYVRAAEIWRGVMREAAALAKRFHVLLCGHVAVKTFQDPALTGGYDRYQLKIHEKSAGIIRESLDLMLFCTFRTDLIRDRKTKEVRAVTDGSRIMYTEFRPAWLDAKNRFNLPFEMPMEWDPLAKAIRGFYSQVAVPEPPKTQAGPAEPPPEPPSPEPEPPPPPTQTQ
jgi:hypothetical protein